MMPGMGGLPIVWLTPNCSAPGAPLTLPWPSNPPSPAAACISELDTLSTAVAAAAPQQKPAAPGPGPAGGAASAATQQSRHKWNVLPSALSSKVGVDSSLHKRPAQLHVHPAMMQPRIARPCMPAGWPDASPCTHLPHAPCRCAGPNPGSTPTLQPRVRSPLTWPTDALAFPPPRAA